MIELKCLDDYDEIVEYKYDSAKELSGEYWKDSIDIDVPSNDSRVVELKVDGRVVENMAYFSDVVNYLGIDKEKLVGEYHQEYVGDRQGEWDMEQVIEGLKDMHIKYDLLQSEPEIGNEGKRAEAIGKAIKWLENPKAMAFVPENDFNAVYDTLKVMKDEVSEKRDRYLEVGYVDAPGIEEYFPLDYAVNKLAGDYHYYQTEILDVQRSEETGDDYGMVHFRQGQLSGYGLVPMELLDEEYEGKETEDKAIVQDLIKQGELELPDLCKLPGNCDISPTLLNFYDDIRQEPPGRIGYTEEDLKALADSERFKWKGYQAVRDEIEADLILYPSLRGSINLDPVDEIGDLKYGIEFENDFRTCIADDYPSARYVKMAAIFHDMPGEEIFEKIEESLRIVAKMDTQRTLKEAMTQFVALSGQDVLVSLKHEAEAKDVRKGSTVLHGTMKFETQKDRQEAYKWAKKWLNKPIKELCHEISMTQEKDKSQGR